MARFLKLLLTVPVAAGLLAGAAMADYTVDLTTAGASGFGNGAFFQQIDPQSTGTGVIDPFLRIQANNTEEGYNTDGSPFEFDEKAGIWTHALLLSDVPIVNVNGTAYRQFLLDINEPNGKQSTLSMNSLQIFLSNDNMINKKATLDGLGAVYDLDGVDNGTVELDYDLNPGSGAGDMFAYIPNALFVGGNYVYLYSAFGDANKSGDGFEEWAVLKGEESTVIPAPGAVVLALIGLGLVGRVKRSVG